MNACYQTYCPDGKKPFEKPIDPRNLPYVMPYSDTSTRLFLKNGKDTLLFKSQGLKETFTINPIPDICDEYRLQENSIKMAASENDYFVIYYNTHIIENPDVFFYFVTNDEPYRTKKISERGFSNYTENKIVKINILNTVYDSVYSLYDPNFEELYVKPNIGLLKLKTSKYTLELIN